MESTALFSDTETQIIGGIIIVLLIALLILRMQGSQNMKK